MPWVQLGELDAIVSVLTLGREREHAVSFQDSDPRSFPPTPLCEQWPLQWAVLAFPLVPGSWKSVSLLGSSSLSRASVKIT